MAFTHTRTCNFSSGSGTVSSSLSYSGTNETNVSESLAAGANQDIVLAVDVSALVSLYIKSDEDCTIYVNDVSGGSPTKTVTLAADEPYVWPMGGNTSPLGASDVTVLYMTTTETETNIEIRVLQDATP